MQSIPANPYIPDRPARDAGKFFGREDILSWIASRLTQHSLVAIHGPPRIGASSILWQVCQRHPDLYQAFYLPLQSPAIFSAMQEVARTVSTGLGLAPTDSPQALRQALADSIYDTQRLPVLICVDGLASWELRAKTDLLNALGSLAAASSHVHFVLAWGLLEDDTITRDMPLRLIGLTESLAPVAQIRLGALTRAEAGDLITATAGSLLKYDFAALERIWSESNGRPAALQMIGFAVYERRALSGRVSARDVEQAISDAVARLAGEMSEQWQGLTREEQLSLAAAATVRGEHGLLTPASLCKELQASHFGVSEPDIEMALARFTQLDILEPAGVQSFRFSSGLLRDWAIQYANLAAVTGTPDRPNWLARQVRKPSLSVRFMRLMSWTLLLAFVGFVVMGGAQFVQGINPAPTSVPVAVFATPSRTPIPLPSPTPVPTNIIAYMFRKTDKDKWRITLAGANGIEPSAVTNGIANDQWPSWSPDGSKIAFTSDRDGHFEVYIMNRDGTGQTRLTRTGTHSWSPSWSFDGAKILFSSFRDRNWEIYAMNADGSQPTRLTDDPAEDQAAVWSPDGRAIAFASKRTGNYEIYLMNPDGSAVTRLTTTSANNFSPAWSPDSRHIAFESNRDGNWEIYVMDGDGSNIKNLTNSPANEQGPAWSPDGQSIAFYSNRDGHSDIWVMRPDGNDPQNWTQGAGSAQFPSWRPTPKPAQ